MPRCSGITRGGDQCSASVPPGVEHCFNHDPRREAERRSNAAKAGRARPNREMADLKADLRAVLEGVRSGEIERGVGAVLFQGYNVLLKAVETERRVKETEELEGRLQQLEEHVA